MPRVRNLLLAVAVALAAALLPAATASAASLAAVQAKLTREMRLAGPSAGLVVRDLQSGRTIFAVHADSTRVPASVEKLFTTTASFMREGPDARIPTRALVGAPAQDGVVAGPLYLVGRGDPTLSTAGLQQLAANIRAAGVTRIDGGIRGDDSAFDHLVGDPDSGYAYDSELGGLLTGLAVNRGWDTKHLQSAPAASAARRLARDLKLAGVRVSGSSTSGVAPPTATEVARVESPPLSAIVAAMNGPSDNYLAEMLLKQLGATHGAGGTTAAGAKAVEDALDDIGVRPRIVDGSGLSRRDRTTPRQVVRLLQRVANMDFAEQFTASLPIAGRTGTLEHRMRGTVAAGACRAKTGTLRYTSNLAGYCTTGDGGVVAFAVLMNGVNVTAAHGIQDGIAATLAGWDGTGAGPDVAPPATPQPGGATAG